MKYLVIATEQDYGEEENFGFEELTDAMRFIEKEYNKYSEFQLYKTVDFNIKVTVEIS